MNIFYFILLNKIKYIISTITIFIIYKILFHGKYHRSVIWSNFTLSYWLFNLLSKTKKRFQITVRKTNKIIIIIKSTNRLCEPVKPSLS